MCLNGCFAVNHFYDIMAVSGDNAHLIDLLWVLLCFHFDRQHRRSDDAALQASLPSTHSLHGVNKDVSPLRFVLVLGDVWASGELGGVLFVGEIHALVEEGLPHLIRRSIVQVL